MVLDGRRVAFAVPAVAARVGSPAVALGSEWIDAVPSAATVSAGQPAAAATGRPGGFVVVSSGARSTLLRVSCAQLIHDNQSEVRDVPVAEYTGYELGPELFCRPPR